MKFFNKILLVFAFASITTLIVLSQPVKVVVQPTSLGGSGGATNVAGLSDAGNLAYSNAASYLNFVSNNISSQSTAYITNLNVNNLFPTNINGTSATNWVQAIAESITNALPGFVITNGDNRTSLSLSNIEHVLVNDNLLLTNPIQATVGAQKSSPVIVLAGSGWKTASTAGPQNVNYSLNVVPTQGSSSPGSLFVISNSINGAAYTDIMHINQVGFVTFPSTVAAGGNLQAGNGFSINWSSGTILRAPADGAFHVRNNAESQTNFFVDASGNANVKQTLTAGDTTHGVIISNANASAIIATDAGKQLTNINVGAGMSFANNTLSATNTQPFTGAQFTTVNPSSFGFRKVFIFQAIGETGSTTTGYSTWGWNLSSVGSSVSVAASSTSAPYILSYQTGTANAHGFQDVNTGGPSAMASYNKNLWFTFRIQLTNTVNLRYQIGISDTYSTQIGQTQIITNNVMMFTYSTNSADWFFTTGDGTAQTTTDTTLAANTSDVVLSFVYNVGVNAIAFTNGVACCTNTIHLPTGTWTPLLRAQPTATTTDGFKIYGFYGEQDW